MHPLRRKLLRDLWHIKGQVLAVALVIGCAAAVLIMSLGVVRSLEETKAAYYERYRFADIFAEVKRAPERLRTEMARIPGVSAVETRIVADVTLDLPGIAEPVTGRLVSLPRSGRPRLNDIALRGGRLPARGRTEEAVIAEAFAEATGLDLGDSLFATLNGRRSRLTVVGIGLSPEYVYTIAPGALMPDDRRFGVIWTGRETLEAAFDLEGAFNSVSLGLLRGVPPAPVLEQLDRLLKPYGGIGAVSREDQVSNWYLENEIAQLQAMNSITPPIFLAVAAFLINIVVGRIIDTEREQIGLLKAFGYTDWAVARHYVEMVLVIVALGATLGATAGAWLGRSLTELYTEFFRFPFLYYRPSLATFAIAGLVSAVAALAGAVGAVRRAVNLAPAVAMAPAPPPTYRRTRLGRLPLFSRLDQPTRMIVRHLVRWPARSALTSFGIAMAAAILVAVSFARDSIDHLIDVQFFQTQRQDLTVTFADPRPTPALLELERLPGVLRAEPFRSVPVTLRNGRRFERTAITGVDPGADLVRLLDAGQRPIEAPPAGLVLSTTLAEILAVAPGELVRVEVLEGRQSVRAVPVAGLVEEYIGAAAYMATAALPRLLGEGPTISGAYLAVDTRALPELYRKLKDLPAVATVLLQTEALRTFRETMAENLLIMIVTNTTLAGLIALGVIYNSARVALSERGRELASLRVLGFTEGEVAYILLGELALLTALALPVGCIVGYGLSALIASLLKTELYRIPLVIEPSTYGYAVLVVVAAAAVSALAVGRRIFRLDLIAVLKTRE